MSLYRRATAEALGTFGLVFIACGAVVTAGLPNTNFGLLGIACAQAIVLAVMVTATMNISGGHLNPAVTIGLLAGRRIGSRDALVYIGAQLAGALVAAWLVGALMPPDAVSAAALGTPQLQNGITFTKGVAIEAVLTFFLMSAVYGTAVAPTAPKVGGFAIGLTLLFDLLVGGNLTGGAMNPARALGPAVVSGTYLGQAVYWIGPILGALVATVLWEQVLIEKEPSASTPA